MVHVHNTSQLFVHPLYQLALFFPLSLGPLFFWERVVFLFHVIYFYFDLYLHIFPYKGNCTIFKFKCLIYFSYHYGLNLHPSYLLYLLGSYNTIWFCLSFHLDRDIDLCSFWYLLIFLLFQHLICCLNLFLFLLLILTFFF